MIKTILGWDISSATTAYAVIEIDDKTKDIKFIKSDYIKPLKKGTILERVADTRNKVQKIINDVKPDYIAIEDIVSFIRNKSTARTVIVLTTFNRMIGLLSYDYLKGPPELLSVLTIRHGLKTNNKFPAKEEMPELVAQHLGIKFPYEYNKKGKIKVESMDKADSIAVALYYAFMLTGKAKAKVKKK